MDINIKDDGVYDIKEVNELTKIPIRNLQRIALRRNLEKVGKSYIFTGADIKDLWLKTVSPPKDTASPPSGGSLNFDLNDLKLKNNIKVERAKKNITQAELATLAKVSRQTINNMELGKYVPSTVLSLKLAHIFNVEVSQLFTLEGSEPPTENK